MDKLAVMYHEYLKNYDFGIGHPFRGNRFPRYINLIKSEGLLKDPSVTLYEPIQASKEDIANTHSYRYIEQVEQFATEKRLLTLDTPLNPSILKACKYIIGGGLKAAELIARQEAYIADVIGGGLHHAGPDYGGGFCVFNDVAICANSLIKKHDINRVLIFDTDAHSGNRTMDIFYNDSNVLFISFHQDPRTIYPGVGFMHELGAGKGTGYTVNIPLPPGTGDECLDIIFKRLFTPLVEQFKPQVIIRNGGPDAHYQDGLARLGLTYEGFWEIGKNIKETAAKHNSSIINMSCSGYNPETVTNGMYAILLGLLGKKLSFKEKGKPPNPSPVNEAERVIDGVIEALSNYWSL